MKISIPIVAFAILCTIAYFEQTVAAPAPELRNFWEDIDAKVKSIYQYGKRIIKNPKGEGKEFLEKCITKDVAIAAGEGAKRNSEEGTLNIAIGAIRKAVAKCARKLDVYVKEKKDKKPIEETQPESEPKQEEPKEEEPSQEDDVQPESESKQEQEQQNQPDDVHPESEPEQEEHNTAGSQEE